MNPLTVVVLILLVLLLVGAFPVWPHSMAWGYWPASGVGVVLVIVLLLLLLGRL